MLKDITITLLLFFFITFIVGCSYIVKWHKNYPDNVLEEVVEDVIEKNTCYDVDLTPFTGSEKQEVVK